MSVLGRIVDEIAERMTMPPPSGDPTPFVRPTRTEPATRAPHGLILGANATAVVLGRNGTIQEGEA